LIREVTGLVANAKVEEETPAGLSEAPGSTPVMALELCARAKHGARQTTAIRR
jgi:hypothetical protein